MKLGTFFQACTYIVVVMLIFTLAVNFVSASGFFDISAPVGVGANETASEQFESVTEQTNITDLWQIVLGAVGLIGLVAVALTRSTTIIGVYLFSLIFWASYLNMMWVTSIGNYIPTDFALIGTSAMIFIWFGAIIGMLTGSG